MDVEEIPVDHATDLFFPVNEAESSRRHEVLPVGRLRKRDGGTPRARVSASMVLAGCQRWPQGRLQRAVLFQKAGIYWSRWENLFLEVRR